MKNHLRRNLLHLSNFCKKSELPMVAVVESENKILLSSSLEGPALVHFLQAALLMIMRQPQAPAPAGQPCVS